MAIKNIERVWANSGTKTEPSTAKQDLGWVNNEQVPYEYLNWLQDKIEAKINEVIQERLNSFYDGATDYQSMISTGLWDDSWGNGADTSINRIDPSGGDIRDLAVFFNSDNEARLLVVETSTLTITVWDPRSLSLEDTSGALSDDLPTGSSQTWEPYSMCTDGTHVYVTFVDTNASPNTYQIQSWLISDWSVNTGWAATGTALPGTGSAPTVGGLTKAGKVIVASAAKLATSNNWNIISAATSDAVSIIDITNGSIDDSAAGDAPTGVSAQSFNGLSSDGTNVFFLVSDGSDTYVCSATIANPQVGCGGSNYPLTVSSALPGGMVSCGSNMIVTGYFFTSSTETDGVLRTHNATDADLDVIVKGQSSAGTPVVGEWLVRRIYDMVFDGLNVWLLASSRTTSGYDTGVVLKIDVDKLTLTDVTTSRQLGDIASPGYNLIQDSFLNLTTDDYFAITFDGRDIWGTFDTGGSGAGYVYRLPLALLRS